MGKKGGWFSAVRKAFIPSGDSKDKKEKKPQKTVSKKSWFGRQKAVEPDSSMAESAFATPALRSPPSEPDEELKLAESQNAQSEPTKLETETSKPTKPENEQSEPTKTENIEQSKPTKPEIEQGKPKKPEYEPSKPKKPENEPSKPKKLENEQNKNSFKARAAGAAAAFRRLLGKSKEEVAAIKVQTAFRRFLARKSLRAIKGSERLKALVQSQSVKRQAITTLRCMQTLARVQSQVRARRIRMTEENQALQRQLLQKRERELENLRSSVSDWDNSRRTKEQVDASIQKRVEATALRERALAYAQTQQYTWKNPSKSANPTFMDPNNPHWGWSWLDRWMAARPWESQSSIDNQQPKGLTRSSSVGDTSKQLDRSPSVSSPRSPSVSRRRLAPSSPKNSNDPMQSPRNRRHSISNTSFHEESTRVSSPRVSSPRVSSPRVSSPRSTKTKSMIPSPNPSPSPSPSSNTNLSPLGSGKKGASENKPTTRPVNRRMSLSGAPAGGSARRLSVPPKVVASGSR
ncbi:protein IQ-DOMAIN 1-like [Cynara cardunculus var. scolymus]|uniref:protein IQ-DOMAIN 1-like n=1 Tax=Cynara cardunculus var. scolymus TaxID=59895 RepID=UPI000D62B9B2|nr:protein IQ-DOMAIN 1-like [Cynara cardunculus var. scolymus]